MTELQKTNHVTQNVESFEDSIAKVFSNPLDLVRYYAGAIQNGRTLMNIHEHGLREMRELEDEIVLDETGGEPGPDGIVGEAIDVIACMLDAIFVHAPETTNEEIVGILGTKCAKWARRYHASINGDRSID